MRRVQKNVEEGEVGLGEMDDGRGYGGLEEETRRGKKRGGRNEKT